MHVVNAADQWHFEQEKKIVYGKIPVRLAYDNSEMIFNQLGVIVTVHKHSSQKRKKYRLCLWVTLAKNPDMDVDVDSHFAFVNRFITRTAWLKPKHLEEKVDQYLEVAKELCLLRENGWHIVAANASYDGKPASWNIHKEEKNIPILVHGASRKYEAIVKKAIVKTYGYYNRPLVEKYTTIKFVKKNLQHIQAKHWEYIQNTNQPAKKSVQFGLTEYDRVKLHKCIEKAKNAELEVNIEKRLLHEPHADIEKIVEQEVRKHMAA